MNSHGTRLAKGFTIIELMIVISVIAVIAGFSFAYLPNAMSSARDEERVSDIESIGRYLEQQYVENASADYPTYPSTESFNDDIDRLASGGLRESLIAPEEETISLTALMTTSEPTLSTGDYGYRAFRSDGSICSSRTQANPCVRYELWYQLENESSATYIDSRRQQ